jgi:hypothetical protein
MIKFRHIFVTLFLALTVFACPALFAQTKTHAPSDDPTSSAVTSQAQVPLQPTPNSGQATRPAETAIIQGKVADVNNDSVAGASIIVQGPEPSDVRTVTTNDDGLFEIRGLAPGIPYHVTIGAKGFELWESPTIILMPGQRDTLNIDKLKIAEVTTSVTVTPESSDEIATQEVKIEEKQRGLGVIPNFFEAYGPHPAPLTVRLKFNLAFRVVRDPFTAVGVAILAAGGQVEGSPNYGSGIKGYGERFGANYANQFTDLMIGGAILPSLLRQDPRYFYQGTGTKKSRVFHAISSLVVTKGDSGLWQPNYSSLGGDLASAAISNIYYPRSNRGVGLVFENFAIDSAVHLGVRLLQEFAFRPTQGTTAH